jgi:hypothetical protein
MLNTAGGDFHSAPKNINFIDEKGLSEDALCRVVIVRLNVRYNPNNLFMIQSAITQALRS